MYQHFKKGKNLNAAPPDAAPGASAGSREAPIPCPEYDQTFIGPMVQRLEQDVLLHFQSERSSSIRSMDRSTPSHRGHRAETYSLLSEDEGMEDDDYDQDPVRQVKRDFPVQEPEPAL